MRSSPTPSPACAAGNVLQTRSAGSSRAVEQVIGSAPAAGDVAIVSHGGVGALLLCHLKAVPISRAEDQPGDGGGNRYAFHRDSRRLVSGWQSIED